MSTAQDWRINGFGENWICQAAAARCSCSLCSFHRGLIVRKCCLTVGWGHGLTSKCGSVESDNMLLPPIHSGPFYCCISRSGNLGQRTMHSVDRSGEPEPFSCPPLTPVPEPSHPNTHPVLTNHLTTAAGSGRFKADFRASLWLEGVIANQLTILGGYVCFGFLLLSIEVLWP